MAFFGGDADNFEYPRYDPDVSFFRVHEQGRFVGIIFDGNLESLVWNFVYSDKQGRAVAVHCVAIEEALRKLYDAAPLADELGR